MPSPRPVKPSFSVVVAFTEMREPSTPRMAANRADIAAACGAILGRSQIKVTSALASRPPRSAIRLAAWVRKRALSASFHAASEGGK